MTDTMTDRQYWVDVLVRVTTPVLEALTEKRLKRDMPCETNGSFGTRYTHLEAVGRLLSGIAPWLACDDMMGDEAAMRDRFRTMAVQGITSVLDPQSPDCIDFAAGHQVVVHTSFLAQAMLRAPAQLWEPLDTATQNRFIEAMKAARAYTPSLNNWLLFAALTETMLRKAGAPWDRMRVDYALRQHEQWYAGDGVYADGPAFHFDYYNAFVIYPFMLEVLDEVADEEKPWAEMKPRVAARAQRYAAIQERLISPEGAIPPIGRSLAYRFGALQGLAHAALRYNLPEDVTPAQARCAMTAVIRRMTEAPGTFDDHGWLTVGFCGHQPAIGEGYISTGSVYLCAEGLLPLGLPASDPFWKDAPAMWTAQKAWSGVDLPCDHAIRD